VVLLGYNAVRNSVVSLSVIKSFSSVLTLEGFDIKDFWKHSLAVAVTGKSLAQLSRKESSDNCFAAGLLHDIGKIILAQYFPSIMPKSALIWPPSGSFPKVWWIRFDGIMSISRNQKTHV
jgi:HD-like signal output (HDOD) protein